MSLLTVLRIATKAKFRRAMSLLELIVSMGLLAVIMVPVISLLSTSTKVMNASHIKADGNFQRTAALDGATVLLRNATRIVNVNADSVDVTMQNGTTARIYFSRGGLYWQDISGVQLVSTGLSNVRFQLGAVFGGNPLAGELLRIETATRGVGEPQDAWSSTNVWIRPTI